MTMPTNVTPNASTDVLSDETWERIAPRGRRRRTVIVIVTVLAGAVSFGAVAWWSGLVAPRLSAEPVGVARVQAGAVDLHVELRNEGLFAADASSVSSGGTLPVRSLEPHLSAGADGEPAESLVLPGWRMTLKPDEKRAVTLRLQVPCDRPVPGWRLEIVAYGPSGGQEVHVPWRNGMAGWREAVVKAACTG